MEGAIPCHSLDEMCSVGTKKLHGVSVPMQGPWACCPGLLVTRDQFRSRHWSLKVKPMTSFGVFGVGAGTG